MTSTELLYLTYKINVYEENVLRKFIYTEGTNYFILNAMSKSVNKYFNIEDKNLSAYRSIVVSNPENKVLCFSPPKSMMLSNFLRIYDNNPSINNIANELIEGVMVNLFYDPRVSKWEIATKSGVGGRYQYHKTSAKNKTFRRMFLDIFRCQNDEDINDIAFLDVLPKNYCYSFVMQHKNNTIVCPITASKLYLVAVYNIHDDNRVSHIPSLIYEDWNIFNNVRGIIDFPKQYQFSNYQELKDKMRSTHNDANLVGIVLTNVHTGDKSSIYNKTYIDYKEALKITPHAQYQYLCICRSNKMSEFLSFFPLHKNNVGKFFSTYHEFIKNVHNSYVDYYVKKRTNNISSKYMSHIYKIHHDVYLPSLSSSFPVVIKFDRVKAWFDQMEPRELLYHLYYDSRTIR